MRTIRSLRCGGWGRIRGEWRVGVCRLLGLVARGVGVGGCLLLFITTLTLKFTSYSSSRAVPGLANVTVRDRNKMARIVRNKALTLATGCADGIGPRIE